MKTLKEMQAEVLSVNTNNGWFESDRTVGDDVALLHSEVSEMFEAFRDGGLADQTGGRFQMDEYGEEFETTPKPEGFGSEVADVLIRLLDTCERRGIDLDFEYDRKITYNSDQIFLRDFVWPLIEKDVLIHDLCHHRLRQVAVSFPSKFGDDRFVGEVFDAQDRPRSFDADMRINFQEP